MEDNKKYQLVLATAHQLFWKFGIKRVTIEEICKEAGISKMTFYRYFPNKIELSKRVLSKVFDDAEENYKRLMQQDISFAEKVKQQVVMKFEGTQDISAEIIADLSSGWNEELQAFYEAYAKKMTTMVYNDYAEAQRKGEIRKDVKLDFIFYMSTQMAKMSADQELLAMYGSVQEIIMEFMNLMFYGILQRK